MARETELKLTLAPRDVSRLLAHPLLASTPPQLQTLRNTYFDTPDLDLLKHRMAVRERRVGRRTLLTVKTAGTTTGGLAQRGEWEQPTAPGALDFSALVDDDALARWLMARAGRLRPMFRTDFRRHSWLLHYRRATIELALDRGFIGAGTATEPRRRPLLELELELRAGPVDALFALALDLSAPASGPPLALWPQTISKAERGYALALNQPEGPRPSGGTRLQRHHSPVDAFAALALDCMTSLQAHAAGIRRGNDPEYVHQARVTLRRLRAALRLFAPVLPARFVACWHPVWSRLAQDLGPLRDGDMLAVRLDTLWPTLGSRPEATRLQRRVHRRHAMARRVAVDVLTRGEPARHLLGFTRALLSLPPPSRTGHEELPSLAELARTQLARRQRHLRQALKTACMDGTTALHALRIEVKKMRLALDCFGPLLPPRRFMHAREVLTRAQDLLGALNDLNIAAEWLDADHHASVGAWLTRQRRPLLKRLPDVLAQLAHVDIPAPPRQKIQGKR